MRYSRHGKVQNIVWINFEVVGKYIEAAKRNNMAANVLMAKILEKAIGDVCSTCSLPAIICSCQEAREKRRQELMKQIERIKKDIEQEKQVIEDLESQGQTDSGVYRAAMQVYHTLITKLIELEVQNEQT